MVTIANRVKLLRVSKRISQRQLADACGISQPTIANIERGRTTEIKGYVLESLARELSTTSMYILEGVTENRTQEQAMLVAELRAIFAKLPPEDQEQLVRLGRGLLQTAVKTPSEINPFPHVENPSTEKHKKASR